MNKSFITIGYFGVPGRMGHLTHLSDGKKPLCGTRLQPEAVYQWCLPHWQSGDPECERCKKIRLGWLIAFNEDKKPNIPMKAPSKTNMAVHFSSNTNEWSTPLPLFYWFNLDLYNIGGRIAKDCPEGKQLTGYIKDGVSLLYLEKVITRWCIKSLNPSQFIRLMGWARDDGFKAGKNAVRQSLAAVLEIEY
jgi:hypothetical protein